MGKMNGGEGNFECIDLHVTNKNDMRMTSSKLCFWNRDKDSVLKN